MNPHHEDTTVNNATSARNVLRDQAPLVPERTPSFVDMRAFANDPGAGIPVLARAGDDAYLSNRRVLDWPSSPVSAGAISLAAGNGTVHYLQEDEFIIIHQGTLTLTQGELTLSLSAGQSAVILQGVAFTWSAPDPVSIIFTRYNRSTLGKRTMVPIQRSPDLKPSGSPALDLLTTPIPNCRNFTDYVSDDGAFMCGTWDSTPYARLPLYYRHFELMHLKQGSVDFVDGSGRCATFSKGDIFLIEQGARCTWDSRDQVAKVYVIYRPQ